MRVRIATRTRIHRSKQHLSSLDLRFRPGLVAVTEAVAVELAGEAVAAAVEVVAEMVADIIVAL